MQINCASLIVVESRLIKAVILTSQLSEFMQTNQITMISAYFKQALAMVLQFKKPTKAVQ